MALVQERERHPHRTVAQETRQPDNTYIGEAVMGASKQLRLEEQERLRNRAVRAIQRRLAHRYRRLVSKSEVERFIADNGLEDDYALELHEDQAEEKIPRSRVRAGMTAPGAGGGRRRWAA
jgi:hypothetical protein